MNNKGDTNEGQINVSPQPVLKPMEGVKIAPAMEGPVNASNNQTATNAANFSVPSIQQQTSNVTSISSPQVTPVVQPQQVVQNTEVSDKPQIVAAENTNSNNTDNNQKTTKVKKRKSIVPFFLLITIILVGYIVYSSKTYKAQIENLNYNCTPILPSKEEIKLDLNSTLVEDLYSKVYTTIREDLAQVEFNDNMKLYLAYRQILEKDKYDSNCNLFSNTSMEPYTCQVSTEFIPKAFKEETLEKEVKKLFGEKTSIPFGNIQLGQASCIGGYQYIAARGEFVQGICSKNTATSFKVEKTLKEATSTLNTIILKEEVKYHENEKMELPSYLKSGIYYYTFRLDMNYNYVLVSKTYESKY